MQSTPDVRVAAPPERLFHVGRKEYPLRFAAIDPLEAARPRAGSRFDVVGAGVLYAASEATCAYKEVIQRLRPAPGARRFAEEGYLNVGSIPASWRDARVLVEFRTVDALPFLDVERDATLTVLAGELADDLARHDLPNLDASAVRSGNRLLTRSIAAWAYAATDETGAPRYSGIRFCSKFESGECWAIFGGTEVRHQRSHSIERNTPELLKAASDFGITIH